MGTQFERSHFNSSFIIACIASSISIGFLGIASYEIHNQLTKEIEAKLEYSLINAENLLNNEFKNYLFGLQGFAGMYVVTSFQPSPRQVNSYAESRQYLKNFPGILGFGFARYLKTEELPNYETKMTQWIRGFKIKRISSKIEDHKLADAMVVESIEPLAPNIPALGLDLGSEQFRRAAAMQAFETGLPVLTHVIKLVQDIKSEPGFLLFLPVYKTGVVPSTLEERKKNLVGWTYAPILASRIYSAIQPYINKSLEISISDLTESSDPIELFSIPAADLKSSTKSDLKNGHLSRPLHRILSINGRDWKIEGRYDLNSEFFVYQLFPLLFFAFGTILMTSIIFWVRGRLESKTQFLKDEQAQWQKVILDAAQYSIIATTPEGIISTFNSTASKWLGYESNEVIGKQNPAIFHDLTQVKERSRALSVELGKPVEPGFDTFVIKALATGIDTHDWTYIRKDGSRFPVRLSVTTLFDSKKTHIGYLAIAQDLSEFKLIEYELKQIVAALKNSAIVDTTDSKGKIIECNDNFCQISGYTREELIDQDHRLINSKTHPKEFFSKLWNTVRSGKIWNGEIHNKSKKGENYWVQTVISPLYDKNKKIDRYLAIGVDVTERKNSELKLQHSAQMTLLAEMAGGIAHEINNPLAIIRGKATKIKQLLAGANPVVPQINSDLDRIEVTVDRIAKIVKGLRTFSRTSDDEPIQLSPIQQIIDDTLDLCQERFRNHAIDLRVSIKTDVSIECRSAEVSQVILNLLFNARDAVESLQTKWVELDVNSDSTEVTISITDSGSGIPAEIIHKIMLPFFTTKVSGKDTGLGLSMSVGIAQSHQGSLRYDSSSPNTKFILKLPIAQNK